jgi:hypothetical protein
MSYLSIEQSEYSAAQTFLYQFVGAFGTFRWTSAPLAIDATIATVSTRFLHPRGGISHNDPTMSPQADRGNLEITVSHRNPIIRAHREFPPAGDTEVTVWRQNEIGGDVFEIWSGVVIETPIVGSVGIIRSHHWAAVVAGSEGLSEKWAPTCPFMTYQFPCPAQVANHSTAVVVSAIDTENFTVEVTGITQIDHWFNAGVFAVANGDKRFILDHTGDVLTLLQNFPVSSLKVGDSATLIDGDDHLYQTCRDKFGGETGNGAAFGGNHLQANKNVHAIGRIEVS